MNETLELFKDALFWIALLAAFSALGLYLINRRTFSLFYKKPKIKIMEISVKPKKEKFEHEESFCYIEIQIINPSSFGNHVSGILRKSRFSSPLATKMYRLDIKDQEGDYCELPGFGKIFVRILPGYEKIKKYENKKMLLTIKDIRDKKIRKYFILKNTKNN